MVKKAVLKKYYYFRRILEHIYCNFKVIKCEILQSRAIGK